jgi:ribosome-associated translation inhibitor RaiA
MNVSEPKTILSTEGFNARPELLALTQAKAAKLRRHETPTIGHVRLHVRLEAPREGPMRFTVAASAETRGLDFIVHSFAWAPEAAIASAFVKLERSVANAAKLAKHRLHESNAVEIAAELKHAM